MVFWTVNFLQGYILNALITFMCLMDAVTDENEDSLFRKMFRLWNLAH
jgi:hypothetical protein